MISPSELEDLFFSVYEEELKRMDSDIEFILRNKIDKPIKGKITKGKLRYRGIEGIAFSPCNTVFLGVMQRGKVVTK